MPQYTFEISFKDDYRSDEQVYLGGSWYNIPRIAHQFCSSAEKASAEAQNLTTELQRLSGIPVSWRVIEEKVVAVGQTALN